MDKIIFHLNNNLKNMKNDVYFDKIRLIFDEKTDTILIYFK